MPRFKKKPLIIEAVQWTGKNIEAIWDVFGAAGIYGPTETNPDYLLLTTPDGFQAPCYINDWVVPSHKQDTFHPVNPHVMDVKYDRLPD